MEMNELLTGEWTKGREKREIYDPIVTAMTIITYGINPAFLADENSQQLNPVTAVKELSDAHTGKLPCNVDMTLDHTWRADIAPCVMRR